MKRSLHFFVGFAIWVLAAGLSSTALSANLYTGTSLGFGQSQITEKSIPRVAYSVNIEGGMSYESGPWNQIDMGLEGMIGQAGYRISGKEKANLSISGFLIKAGYGKKLGNDVWLFARLGVGPTFVTYKANINEVEYASSSTIVGLSVRAAGEALVPVNDQYSFLAGLRFTRIQVDLDDLGRTPIATDTTKDAMERPIAINVPELYVGLRVKI